MTDEPEESETPAQNLSKRRSSAAKANPHFMARSGGNQRGQIYAKARLTSELVRQVEADPKLLPKIVRAWINTACEGSVPALALMLDRLEGPLQKQMERELPPMMVTIQHISDQRPITRTIDVRPEPPTINGARIVLPRDTDLGV